MNKLSPSDARIRIKRNNSFDKNWHIDFKTNEIKLNEIEGWSKFLNIFWKRKFTVDTLYWWSHQKWATMEMMPYPIAIKRDDIPAKGLIRKHQMTNGWTISKKDLKSLYKGPLIDESGNEILVKTQSNFKRFISFLSQLKPISWISSFVIILYRYRKEVMELIEKIQNVL